MDTHADPLEEIRKVAEVSSPMFDNMLNVTAITGEVQPRNRGEAA